jgi:hypothetical protein
LGGVPGKLNGRLNPKQDNESCQAGCRRGSPRLEMTCGCRSISLCHHRGRQLDLSSFLREMGTWTPGDAKGSCGASARSPNLVEGGHLPAYPAFPGRSRDRELTLARGGREPAADTPSPRSTKARSCRHATDAHTGSLEGVPSLSSRTCGRLARMNKKMTATTRTKLLNVINLLWEVSAELEGKKPFFSQICRSLAEALTRCMEERYRRFVFDLPAN